MLRCLGKGRTRGRSIGSLQAPVITSSDCLIQQVSSAPVAAPRAGRHAGRGIGIALLRIHGAQRRLLDGRAVRAGQCGVLQAARLRVAAIRLDTAGTYAGGRRARRTDVDQGQAVGGPSHTCASGGLGREREALPRMDRCRRLLH